MRHSIVMRAAGRTAVLLLALALLAALVACSGDDDGDAPAATAAQETPAAARAEPEPADPIRVVVTTNIVADWVENVGGEHVDVFSLVPVGADPHGFQPGAQDVAKVADADLVLSVGLGLEESWLRELLDNAARDPDAIVELGEVIEPIEFAASHAEEVELLEEISHVVHEVEEGEIDAATGLEEIGEVLDAAEAAEAAEEGEDHGEEEGEDHAEEDEAEEEGDDHAEEEGDDHAGEEELHEMVREIIADAEAGTISAEEAIEEIEHLTEEGEGEHDDHGHGIHDPHFWFDPIRVQLAVSDIAARLAALDPDRADAYRANADAYNAQLDELHAWTEEQVGVIPVERRLLVTSHDSLGYFAERYGFEVVGVILSITTEVEPSAEDLIELTEEIEKYDVPAVFGETTVSERLAESVATESGAVLVRLYSGSLGTEGSGAETYIAMVRTNVERVTEALR